MSATLPTVAPDRANAMIADAASSGDGWSRETLVAVVGHRLAEGDRSDLATTNDPSRLVDLMGSVGVLSPETMLRVLRAESVDLDMVVGLIPTVGLAVPDAIRQVHAGWGADRLSVGMELGATVDELRAAGCSPVEMLAASPREELRRLDTREQTWVNVGPTLLEAGYTEAEAVAHLAAHAPTPSTFAAAVEAVVENPWQALALAVPRAQPDDLAALTERFEMSPSDTAAVLAAVGAPLSTAVSVVGIRCDDDREATCEIAQRHFGIGRDEVLARLEGIDPNVVVPIGLAGSPGELAALRHAIGPPDIGSSMSIDSASLREALAALVRQVPGDAEIEMERVT